MNSILIYNGIIHSNYDNPKVNAVFIKNNIIDFVGAYNEAEKLINKDTLMINLNGRSLLPGFNDSHMHLISYGLSKLKVNFSNSKSIKDFQNEIKEFIKNEDKKYFGDWVIGCSWNQENFIENRMPTKEDIDRIISDRPVFLARACYHIGVANSKALELLNINKETEDPAGGKIDKDPITGEPTGILRENALNSINNAVHITDNVENLKEIIKSSISDANKTGITSVQTDDFFHIKKYNNVIKAYEELRDEGKLNARINLQLLLDKVEKLEEFLTNGVKTGDGDNFFKFGPLKVLADGSLGSRTAALEENYNDDNKTNGMLLYNDDELYQLLKTAYNNGLQIAVHAIGDRCINQVIKTLEDLDNKYVKKDPRHRIIHCQICSDDILNKLEKNKIIADIQPIFINTDLHMAEKRVGNKRMKYSYAWNSMLNRNIHLSGSSDSPIEPFNPIYGIYSCVARKDLSGFPESGWYSDEAISLNKAIELFTTNSAYATFEENLKGKIKKGMLADLIVLSDNIFNIEVDEIKDIEVDITIVNGKIVYNRKSPN